jgi:nitrate reductase beta subunit
LLKNKEDMKEGKKISLPVQYLAHVYTLADTSPTETVLKIKIIG